MELKPDVDAIAMNLARNLTKSFDELNIIL